MLDEIKTTLYGTPLPQPATQDPRTRCLGAPGECHRAATHGELADAFVAAHPFTALGDDALHATAVFVCDYRARLGVRWAEFPVDAFLGVFLPSALYGFDALRDGVTRGLPFFVAWLVHRGDLERRAARALLLRPAERRREGRLRTAAVGACAVRSLPENAPAESWSSEFEAAETRPGRRRVPAASARLS